jgi:hypothetical protein
MSDFIGRISVSSVVLSTSGSGIGGTQVFPLIARYNIGFSQDRPVITHRFGSLDAKQEQRYFVGIGARKFPFQHPALNWTEKNQLRDFWEAMQGPWMAFTYPVPNADGTTSNVLVTFEQTPLSFDYLRNVAQVGFNFVEVVDPAAAPVYSIVSTCLRFPSDALTTALLSEIQEVVPLVHIRVREQAVPDIYLSDRRCTVGGQLYLPRLTGMGEQGSDVIISQDIKGSADNVKFTFGNADRAMTALANDTDLTNASIDLCLYHVNSGILLQLWKGVIRPGGFVSDGTANFPVSCSDGVFQMTNQYPARQISRQGWKTFNDGVLCPYSAQGSGGDPNSCDYYLESANGCQAHGMSPYFCGIQCDPQDVRIKDNSTGLIGLGRNSVTSTSIISDSVWGAALSEIYCNSAGNALRAFMAPGLIVAYRDESDFADSLGILGAGPLGGFTPSAVVMNADGFKVVVAPTVDGFTWQGFKVDGNLNITKFQPGMGLRFIGGGDPVNASTDYFSLGQGTPQVWQANNYAAGVAACEIRIVKDSTLQPSTPDQHQMVVPIDYGMWGWVWDHSGTRSAVKGLVDPFWICVNMMLRSMGLYGNPSAGIGPSSATQLNAFVLSSLAAGGTGASDIAGTQVVPIFGTPTTTYSITTAGQALYAAQVNYNTDGSCSFSYWNPAPPPPPYGQGQQFTISIGEALALGYVTASSVVGTETQFQFQGVISSQKPFRDWLTEVLSCCLGYYTFEFGQLKLGIRSNASAVDAYTLANTLFQSLRLSPITGAFEKLVISYADVAYQYQANTAEYCDKSHAAYYGRSGSPLTSQMHSVGTSTLSQALRIAATRTREEIGGVTPAEWRAARNATWQTTLLGLGNSVGQVVSQTHPEIPGLRGTCNVPPHSSLANWASGDPFAYAGTANGDTSLIGKAILIGVAQAIITAVASDGSSITTDQMLPAGIGQAFHVITMNFRIQKWSLKKDWSIEMSAQTVTPSMYDPEVGPKPMDVVPGPLPVAKLPAPSGPAWAPYQVQASANDALFPGEWTFNSDQEYPFLSGGVQAAQLIVAGKMPVSAFSNTGAGAPGIGSIVVNPTGGSLPANSTLWVSLCAIDSTGAPTAPSKVAVIGTGPAAGGSLTLNDIVWPAVAGLASYVLFVGIQDDLVCAQQSGALTAGSGGTTYTPGSVTFGGPVLRSTWALPSSSVARVRIKAKPGINHGISGLPVSAVSTNTITCGLAGGSNAIGATITSPATWVGRIASVIGRSSGATPFASFVITGFNSTTGDFSVTPNPTGIVLIGDAIVIRNKADAPNSGSYTSITDSGYCNSTENTSLGLIPNSLIGCLIRVVAGLGRGTPPRLILSNTATSIIWDLSMPLDATSVWIIEGPTWQYQQDSSSIGNASPSTSVAFSIPVGSFITQPMVIAGFTVDVDGNESPDGDAPIREDWIYGAGGDASAAS